MAVFLVDYENVYGCDGLKGTRYLNKDDMVIVFYSNGCQNIRKEHLENIIGSGCVFKTYRLKVSRHNALDFYIAAEAGALAEKGHKRIAVISRDKGFNSIVDFFSIKFAESDIKIVTGCNIESSIVMLDEGENNERVKQIRDDMSVMNIDTEYAKYEERMLLKERVEEALLGTEYEEGTEDIVKFIFDKDNATPKELYTGSLHRFGRVGGRGIYSILKEVI